MKNAIVASNGSIQGIQGLPQELKDLYKTVWEIKQRSIIEMSADRGAYIDQSQSLNIHLEEVNYKKLSAMHFFAWEKGLKTGMYYLRTRPATDPIKFTVDREKAKLAQQAVDAGVFNSANLATAPISIAQPEIFDMDTTIKTFKDKPGDSQFECVGCGS